MATPIDTSGLARALVVNSTLALQRGANNSNPADYLQVNRTQDIQAQEATRRAVRENGLERLGTSRDSRGASSPRAVEDAISNISGRLEAARSEITEQLANTTSPSVREGLIEDLNKVQSAIDGTDPVSNLIDAREQARQSSSASDVPNAASQFQSDGENNGQNAGRADGPDRDPGSAISFSPDRQQDDQAQELRELRQEEIREDQRLSQDELEERAEERSREDRAEEREAAEEQREEREEREREREEEREREQAREAYLEERARDAAAAYDALQAQRREPRVFDASA